MNSAEKLCRRIIEEAEASVAEKSAETQAEVDRILGEAAEKARTVEKEASAEIKRRLDAYEERKQAAATKVIRSAVLLEKARIIDAVVNDAKKALCALDGDAYVAFISNLFKDCGELKEPTVCVQANRKSQEAALRAKLGNVKIEFSSEVDGGALIKEDDIDYDCRVGTVLARFRKEHEPELHELLFGDNR